MPVSINGLAALVGWGMILWRLPRVRLRSTDAFYAFATLVCFTLAATFSTPFVVSWVDSHIQLPAGSLVAEYVFAIAAASFWALSCLSLDVSLRRRRWLILLAPVALVGLLTTWLIYLPEMGSARSGNTTGELILTTLVHAYAFAIVATIAVPALGHRIANEPALPIRLRFLTILATQVILAIWLGARMTLGPLVLLGILPRTYSFSFVNVLIGLMILAYMGSLLPPIAFARMARWAVYWRDWTSLRRLKRIERRTAQMLNASPLDVSFAEAMRTPDYALYRVAIAILDRRKALRVSQNDKAKRLAWRIDRLVTECPGYSELVESLRKIG